MPQRHVNHLPAATCHRTDQPIQIDGRLDKPVWTNAQGFSLQHNDGGAPTHATTVRTLWDARFIYFGFHCQDPQPSATMTRRDDPLWREGNVVEMFIDPAGRGESLFEFQVNPLNALIDLFYESIDQPWQQACAWDAKPIHTGVQHLRDGQQIIGWTAEIAIGLNNFHTAENLPPKPGDVWHANFCRYDSGDAVPNTQQLQAWSPTGGAFAQPEKFGRLIFRS